MDSAVDGIDIERVVNSISKNVDASGVVNILGSYGCQINIAKTEDEEDLVIPVFVFYTSDGLSYEIRDLNTYEVVWSGDRCANTEDDLNQKFDLIFDSFASSYCFDVMRHRRPDSGSFCLAIVWMGFCIGFERKLVPVNEETLRLSLLKFPMIFFMDASGPDRNKPMPVSA